MVAGVELSLFMGLLGGGIIVLRGPASIGHIKNFGCRSKKFFFLIYIFYIGWGSEMGLWVMTAGVEISLFMGYLHGVDTGLRGPVAIGDIVFFGPVRPTWYIFSIYIGGSEPL